jgi:Superinfection immunity protein
MNDNPGIAFFAIMLLLLGLAIYFLPWLVAMARKTPRAPAIFVLNLLLGWTFVGWVVALVWALAEMPQAVPQSITVNTNMPPAPASTSAQAANAKTIVVTAVLTSSSAGSELLEQPALLVREEQNGQLTWRVDAETGPVGRVDGSDAAKIEFNANAVGKPRAVFRSVAPQLTVSVTFGA